MKLEIMPFEGVSDLQFGLSQKQVEALLGPPEDVMVKGDQIREFRRGTDLVTAYSSKGSHLMELAFGSTMRELEFHGVRLFDVVEERAIDVLLRAGKQAHEGVGFLVFLDLGVGLDGFLTRSDNRVVVVSERGRWEAVKSSLKPYRR